MTQSIVLSSTFKHSRGGTSPIFVVSFRERIKGYSARNLCNSTRSAYLFVIYLKLKKLIPRVNNDFLEKLKWMITTTYTFFFRLVNVTSSSSCTLAFFWDSKMFVGNSRDADIDARNRTCFFLAFKVTLDEKNISLIGLFTTKLVIIKMPSCVFCRTWWIVNFVANRPHTLIIFLPVHKYMRITCNVNTRYIFSQIYCVYAYFFFCLFSYAKKFNFHYFFLLFIDISWLVSHVGKLCICSTKLFSTSPIIAPINMWRTVIVLDFFFFLIFTVLYCFLFCECRQHSSRFFPFCLVATVALVEFLVSWFALTTSRVELISLS